jgi:hypothetical protein
MGGLILYLSSMKETCPVICEQMTLTVHGISTTEICTVMAIHRQEEVYLNKNQRVMGQIHRNSMKLFKRIKKSLKAGKFNFM